MFSQVGSAACEVSFFHKSVTESHIDRLYLSESLSANQLIALDLNVCRDFQFGILALELPMS